MNLDFSKSTNVISQGEYSYFAGLDANQVQAFSDKTPTQMSPGSVSNLCLLSVLDSTPRFKMHLSVNLHRAKSLGAAVFLPFERAVSGSKLVCDSATNVNCKYLDFSNKPHRSHNHRKMSLKFVLFTNWCVSNAPSKLLCTISEST